jgi:hypothetical protein
MPTDPTTLSPDVDLPDWLNLDVLIDPAEAAERRAITAELEAMAPRLLELAERAHKIQAKRLFPSGDDPATAVEDDLTALMAHYGADAHDVANLVNGIWTLIGLHSGVTRLHGIMARLAENLEPDDGARLAASPPREPGDGRVIPF